MFLLYLVNYFQKQKVFENYLFKIGFQNRLWGIFVCESFPAFVSMLYSFPSHVQT